MIISARSLSSRDSYRLLSSCVVPRPIAWVTSLSSEGIVNAAPYSFFNAVSADPPMVVIAIERRTGGAKDTARNIQSTKEFVVNIVDESVVEQMNSTATEQENVVRKMQSVGLKLAPSEHVKVPRIETTPVQLECILSKWIEVGNGPTDLILGEIVTFHIKEEIMVEGRIRQEKLQAVGWLSGGAYCRTTDLIKIQTTKRRL